jgi:hypothetical protein
MTRYRSFYQVGVTALVALLVAACGTPAATPSPVAATAVPTALAATATPVPTPTPAIAIPPGLLPPALTPDLLDGLYQRAAEMARPVLPGASFLDVTVEVYPFGSTSRPGTTVFVALGFRADNAVYTYEWRDDTDDLVSRGQTHTIFGTGSQAGACDPLPWYGELADLPALVRYGYQQVHDSFPADAGSFYVLSASSLSTDCLWVASFRRTVNGQVGSVGSYMMASPGFIVEVP